MSLLQLVMIQMNKKHADELARLDKYEKRYLADSLARITDLENLNDWNELLRAMFRIMPKKTVTEAREYILTELAAN